MVGKEVTAVASIDFGELERSEAERSEAERSGGSPKSAGVISG